MVAAAVVEVNTAIPLKDVESRANCSSRRAVILRDHVRFNLNVVQQLRRNH